MDDVDLVHVGLIMYGKEAAKICFGCFIGMLLNARKWKVEQFWKKHTCCKNLLQKK